MNTASLRSAVGSLALVLVAGLPFMQAGQAAAQSQQDGLFLVATVPFAFQIGSQPMPPDTYTIRRFTQHYIILEGARTHTFGTLPVISSADPRPIDHASLIFRRYGEKQYFLGRVNATATQQRLDCSPGKDEKRLAKEQELLTRRRIDPTSVEVASTR